MVGRLFGIDDTLDAPPLTAPPLSLPALALTLINVDQAIGDHEQTLEKLVSAQAAVEAAVAPHPEDPPEVNMARAAAAEEAQDRLEQLRVWESTQMKQLGDMQSFERGFLYLPELGNAESMEIFVPGQTNAQGTVGAKSTSANQDAFYWYDPFDVVAHDDRSLFGWPHESIESRLQRAQRAQNAHEAWQVEREFWTGQACPTNYHLTASPSTPTTSPHRTINAFPNPTAAPTTTLGTAVGLAQSLAALDQAVANSDAGTGMIHASPYVVQRWMQQYPFIRDSNGRVYTVNMNLIVPGYGYPGTGPDENRSVADGVTNSTTTVTSATAAFTANDIGQAITGAGIPAGSTITAVGSGTSVTISQAATASATGVTLTIGGTGGNLTNSTKQWAYATDTVFKIQGVTRGIPWDLREGGPEVYVDDSINVRQEQSWALITNQLLRAAVLIDTTTT